MLNPQIAVEKNIRFIGKILQNTENETAFIRWNLAKKIKEAGFTDEKIIPFDFLHPLVPGLLVSTVNILGKVLENLPLIKEISGSLWIRAKK